MTVLFFANARAMTIDQVKRIRVDREEELEVCVQSLLDKQNVYVWGPRGAGKTFLLRLVADRLTNHREIFVVDVPTLGMLGFGRLNPTSAFSEAVLLAVCTQIWGRVLGEPYSELRETLDVSSPAPLLQSSARSKVAKLYGQLMASQRKAHYESFRSLGFSAGAKGETSEKTWLEQEQPPVLPFEFFEYAGELMEVLREYGFTQMVLLCDEANKLSDDQQVDLLTRYVELFSLKRVQFLFVSAFGERETPVVPTMIRDVFDRIVEIDEFTQAHAYELLKNIAKESAVEINDDVCEIFFEQIGGRPRLLVDVMTHSIGDTRGITNVTAKIAARALKKHFSQRTSYLQTLPSREI